MATRSRAAAKWISGISIAVIVLGVFIVMLQLPFREIMDRLTALLEGLGLLGAVIFGALYVVATVLLMPASAFTIGAGILFGLLGGVVVVSISSTTAAAVAFLIARYAARERVSRMAKQHPRFGAIDRAISEGGWKIVALLRLSPAIPFNLQNYLYGLTAIRFWPYVLTSWLTMLPGTLMYVYVGYLARAGAEEAAEGGAANLGQWVLRILGFAATVAVTVYVTRLARRALKKQTALEEKAPEDAGKEKPEPATGGGIGGRTIALAVIALLVLAFSIYTLVRPDTVRKPVQSLLSAFGPPAVTMEEAYEANPDSPGFDHSVFDQLLGKYVDADGWVDYRSLGEEGDALDAYIESLAQAPFAELGRDEKLALLINAYNAFTLKLILEHCPVESIKDIPSDQRWTDVRWQVGANTWSLNQIEHEEIRPKFTEPRIHFALVCAAIGCPILRNEAYVAERLDEQLADQTEYAHTHDRWFRFDADNNTVHLTWLYQWYGSDFEQEAGSVLKYAARYAPELEQAIEAGRTPEIRWLEYDWRLNSIEHAQRAR